MKTELAPEFVDDAQAKHAAELIRACVHCGFCTATCPTYQLLGDERDSPRGRIYLIQQMLEGQPVTRTTQQHLDRCLTCRACETTCPSGVQYAHLLDIGRSMVEQRVPRPAEERYRRVLLNRVLPDSRLFGLALGLGRLARPLLPQRWQRAIPAQQPAARWPEGSHVRKVLLLEGCVQPALAPDINGALARLLDLLGIRALPLTGCCGAVSQHLNRPADAAAAMRRLIDVCWPMLEAGAEAILVSASGCGAQLKDYGYLLRDDPVYAARARQIAALARDPVELLAPLAGELQRRLSPLAGTVVAFQSPCSLQHGQKLKGAVESLLQTLGVELLPVADAHLCCGSAGTYSLLQPDLSQRLRAAKLGHLLAGGPQYLLSANIGCISHLQAATDLPVRHWLEFVADQVR